MIIAALTALLLGGGGFSLDAMKDSVKDTVSDKARVEQIDDVLSELEDMVTAYQKELESIGQQITELNKDYDAPNSQFQDVIVTATKYAQTSRAKTLDLRFKMKDLMTEEEWTAVFAPKQDKPK